MTQVEHRSRPGEQRRAGDASRRPYRRAQWIGVGLLVALALALVVALVQAMGDDAPASSGSASGTAVAPADLEHGVPVGEADAPVTVVLYFDYLCPACGAFEHANGEELTRLLGEETIRLELRPMAFLDDLSDGTRYSTRAANAMATVADAAPDRVWAFHRALYAAQPAEDGPGLTDEELAELAVGAGVPQEVVDRFADATYEPWTADMTQRAFDDGVEGTPTILIAGRVFDGDPYTTGPLTEAIEQARG
ncbi:DsbA family protein [Nocardioides sp.]|uniref:DsbA family protein n=1 Tax=Nocardioides sp. TaxID=35761 RepID=UPI002ECFB848